MDISQLPLNALRAFEASARHLSFTRAGLELHVSQTAVSHQVRLLEDVLRAKLFRRLPRGLVLTDEGAALAPGLHEAFHRLAATVSRFESGQASEVVTVAVVATFAVGWLIDRVDDFSSSHPRVDLRLLTNNNRVNLAGEGMDFAIRFGAGVWEGLEAVRLMAAPLTPICSPRAAAHLRTPKDLLGMKLLRSYRADEWPQWFKAADLAEPVITGMMFDSSLALAEAASRHAGVALLPAKMFARDLDTARLVRPFDVEISTGSYWLTWLHSRVPTPGMVAFRDWLVQSCAGA